MKTKPTKPKQSMKRKKIYTYDVICSFNLQYSFTESEVEPDPEGGKSDFIPTDEAIRNLEKVLTEAIGFNFSVTNLQADVESDQLLGIIIDE
jgi:hypothetical protein